MPFVAQKPTQSDFDRTVWENGVYDFKLVDIQLGVHNPPKSWQNADPRPAVRFIYEDEEGDRFESDCEKIPVGKIDIDGEMVQIGFAFNEKSKMWKHISALYGRDITPEDTVEFTEDKTYEPWNEWEKWPDVLPPFFTKDVEVATFKSIKVNGTEIFKKGTPVKISLKKWEKDGKSGNNIETVLPLTQGGKSGKTKTKTAPAEDLDLPE